MRVNLLEPLVDDDVETCNTPHPPSGRRETPFVFTAELSDKSL